MSKPLTVGGQAVIEGVMMRAVQGYAIAVRKPDKTISVKTEKIAKKHKFSFMKWPVFRGAGVLLDSMVLGIKSLTYSSGESVGVEEELSQRELWLAVFSGIGLAALLFMVAPTVLMSFFRKTITRPIVLNLLEGITRIVIFTTYVLIISRFEDIQRVFQYHGAEHKAINCYESGQTLTVSNASKFTTLNARCGTAFMLVVMLIAVLFFSLFGWMSIPMRILTRIIFLPVIAGISYEIIKLASKKMNNPLFKLVMAPGLLMQKVTTSEPDDSQLEVAIAALVAAIENEEQGDVA